METMTSEMKPLRLQLELDLSDGRRDIKALQGNRIQRIKDPWLDYRQSKIHKNGIFDCVVYVHE